VRRAVRAVSPEGSQEERGGLDVGGPSGQVVEGGEFLVDQLAGQFGGLEGAEGIDALPRAGREVTQRAEEFAVEVALGPQERNVEPGPAEVTLPPRRPPLAVVRVRAERLDHAFGGLGEQSVEGGVLRGPEGERVAHLPDQHGVAFGQDGPGERPGSVAQNHGRGGRRGRVG
jgi:hypothetical protein